MSATANDLPAYPPIGDHAVIGDCGCAALITRDGAIDWMCWPSFHSPSMFAALLDHDDGGSFTVRPAGRYRSERRYLPGTNVLETTFTTGEGVLRLTDLMPVRAIETQDSELWPDHELLRELRCTEGEVEVDVVFDPRFDYGRRRARLEDRGALGIFHRRRRQVFVLRSDLPLRLSERRDGAEARVRLAAGDRRHLALTHDVDEPAVLPLLGAEREGTEEEA